MNDKTKYKKLLEAHENNVKISNYNLGNKFEYFENSKLDESRTLLYEIESKPKAFKRYSRGSIIKVKLGVNIGSEFSGDHYAIVLTKGDTMNNPILHIVPITSDNSIHNINAKNVLYNEKEITKLKRLAKAETKTAILKDINKCLNYYIKNKDRESFIAIKHIKTISKLSIMPLMNNYDYLRHLKISDELLKIIDNAIVKEYTNISNIEL